MLIKSSFFLKYCSEKFLSPCLHFRKSVVCYSQIYKITLACFTSLIFFGGCRSVGSCIYLGNVNQYSQYKSFNLPFILFDFSLGDRLVCHSCSIYTKNGASAPKRSQFLLSVIANLLMFYLSKAAQTFSFTIAVIPILYI